jgi:hypothetical protein
MEMIALAANSGPDTGIPWLAPTIAILTIMLGSGGFVAWRRLAHDKKIGVAQQEAAEDDALSNRWAAIIEAQTQSLLEPMARRLNTLEEKVRNLETELEASRRKYWSAIAYIRQLLMWIGRHLPDAGETQVPQAPAAVVEDI